MLLTLILYLEKSHFRFICHKKGFANIWKKLFLLSTILLWHQLVFMHSELWELFFVGDVTRHKLFNCPFCCLLNLAAPITLLFSLLLAMFNHVVSSTSSTQAHLCVCERVEKSDVPLTLFLMRECVLFPLRMVLVLTIHRVGVRWSLFYLFHIFLPWWCVLGHADRGRQQSR